MTGQVSRNAASSGPSSVISDAERAFIVAHRVGHLATADETGSPHVVPVCYAFDGRRIYTAIDRKPKRWPARGLKRVLNVLANSSVALAIDDYSEDWGELAYFPILGAVEIVEGAAAGQVFAVRRPAGGGGRHREDYAG